jgi:hypothetical protein
VELATRYDVAGHGARRRWPTAMHHAATRDRPRPARRQGPRPACSCPPVPAGGHARPRRAARRRGPAPRAGRHAAVRLPLPAAKPGRCRDVRARHLTPATRAARRRPAGHWPAARDSRRSPDNPTPRPTWSPRRCVATGRTLLSFYVKQRSYQGSCRPAPEAWARRAAPCRRHQTGGASDSAGLPGGACPGPACGPGRRALAGRGWPG